MTLFTKIIAECFQTLMLLLLTLFSKPRRLTEKHSAAVYGLKQKSHFNKMFATQVLRSHIQIFFETVVAILFRRSMTLTNVTSFQNDILECLESKSCGLVVAAAHHGSWELLAKHISLVTKQPFHVFAKATGNRFFDGLIHFFRRQSNCWILWNHQAESTKQTVRLLKEGRAVGFVMDQRPLKGSSGVMTEFMGMEADFVSGPAKFALRTGSAVLIASCVRVGFFEYKMEYTLIPPEGVQTYSVEALTKQCASTLEGFIKLYPEQWSWEYRRWRSHVIDQRLS